MNNSSIGILDSGIGGLSVWKEIAVRLPSESLIYIADSKNTPYGPREPDEILRLARRLINFLMQKQVKLIVIACNTITVTCIDILRQEYPLVPMIGTVPVIKTAARVTRNHKIGILSTSRTSDSQYQKDLIARFAPDCEVISVGNDDLVPLIEQGKISGKGIQDILREITRPFSYAQCDAVALGCTHYPFIEKELGRILGPQVKLLEPSGAIARHARHILEQNKALSAEGKPGYGFYTTGNADIFASVAKKLLGVKIRVGSIEL